MVNMMFRIFLVITLCTTVLAEVKQPSERHLTKGSKRQHGLHMSQKTNNGLKRRWQLEDVCGRPKDPENFDKDNLSPLDTCCDKRNNCVDIIKSNEYSEKFQLHNDDSMSRVSCKCDHDLFDCLHNLGTPRANAVGWMYYSQYRNPKCFNYDYPALSCDEWSNDGNANPRCKKYEVDKHMPMRYEWRDLPHYEDVFPYLPEYKEPDDHKESEPVDPKPSENPEEDLEEDPEEDPDEDHNADLMEELKVEPEERKSNYYVQKRSHKLKKSHKGKRSNKTKRKHSRKMN